MSQLRAEVKGKAKEVELLKKRLQKSTTQNGIFIDNTTENDLEKIMAEKTEEVRQKFAPDSFQCLFWDQQLDVHKVRDKRQVRWHPMMIRWFLSLKLLSSGSYKALRSSGVVVLPSERTLRDYTHFVKAKPGFCPGIDEQLCQEAKIDSISALRSSGVVVLPSERTLRDYTHFVKAKPGFCPGIDKQLCQEAKIDSISEHQKYVCLVFDEVKVSQI